MKIKTSRRACAALLGLFLMAACDNIDVAEKRQGCDQGQAQSCFDLGTLYALGYGVEADLVLAESLTRRAAEMGHSVAQLNLASMYEDEAFGIVDPIEAYAWYGVAAVAGVELAQEGLERLSEQLSSEQLAQGQRRMDEYRSNVAANPVDDAG